MKISKLIRICLFSLLFVLLAICILWLPKALSYAAAFLPFRSTIAYYLILFSSVVTMLPLFILLLSAFSFASAVERDEIFTAKTAKLISFISNMIVLSCVLFTAAVLALFICGERLLSPVLAFIAVVGFALALMLRILSSYVKQAAILKEEADFTL